MNPLILFKASLSMGFLATVIILVTALDLVPVL